MKQLLVFSMMTLILSVSHAEFACHNCVVKSRVIIHRADVAAFSAYLPTINSMPLQAGDLEKSPDENFVLLSVETSRDYAVANGLNSFDVAKRLSQLTSAGSPWRIKSITATVEVP